MNHCPHTRRAQDFLEGELPSEQARAFADHLRGCALCAAEVEAFRVLFADLGSEASAIVDPGPSLTERVLDRVLPSRLRAPWVAGFGWAYGTASAVTTFAFVSWIAQGSSHVWLAQRLSEGSLRLIQTVLFTFQVLTRSWIELLDGWMFLEALAVRAAPVARALARPWMDPTVAAITVAAVLSCAVVLWWMRPRRRAMTEEVRHVSLVGF